MDYGLQDVNVTINKTASGLIVSPNDQVNLVDLRTLLTSKGKVEFYETHNRLEVIQKPGVDNELTSLLNIPIDDKELKMNTTLNMDHPVKSA